MDCDSRDLGAEERRQGWAISAGVRGGRRTLPLIAMLERVGEAEADRVRLLRRRRALEPAEIEQIRCLVLAHDGVEYALERAHGYARDAKRDLEVFAPSEERELLTLVADFVVDRDR